MTSAEDRGLDLSSISNLGHTQSYACARVRMSLCAFTYTYAMRSTPFPATFRPGALRLRLWELGLRPGPAGAGPGAVAGARMGSGPGVDGRQYNGDGWT